MTSTLAQILAMIRFSHTLFALPFALFAAAMAWTVAAPDGSRPEFRWIHLIGILVCMVCARSAAMAQNRIADRSIDAANPRTQGRHLPAGLLSLRSVILFTVVMSLGFIAGTLLFLPNWLPICLAIPVLLFLFGYSYTKRFTVLAHFWLGASLMLAPLAAWIALRGETVIQFPADILPAVFLGIGVLLWVAGFDIIYACQDAAFDAKSKLRSVPARFGIATSLRIAAVCHLGMILALLALPILSPQVPFGPIYFASVAAVGGLLVYEHWLVRPDDLTRVNIAFFHVNWIVSTGLFLLGTLDLLL